MKLKGYYFFVLAFFALMVCCTREPNNATDQIESQANSEQKKEQPIAAAKQLGFPSGLTSHDEVRSYITELLKEPIPEDYAIPEYITSGKDQEEVYSIFAQRFPMFYGFGSTQLLDSIIANPDEYPVMILENKAIRRYYDPNSKY